MNEKQLIEEALKLADARIHNFDGDPMMGAMIRVQAAQALATIRVAECLEAMLDGANLPADSELFKAVQIWGAE